MAKSINRRWGVLALAGVLALSLPAFAGEVEVKELNKGPGGGFFVFAPELVRVNPGDTVEFAAADKGHDVKSIDGMIPDGAEPFKGKMNEDLKVTFSRPGVYAFECTPHTAMGMVGVVVVGQPSNLDKLDPGKLPGKAKQKLQSLIEQIKASAQAGGGADKKG